MVLPPTVAGRVVGSGRFVEALAAALPQCSGLTQLHLSNVDAPPAALAALLTALNAPDAPKLCSLRLEACGLDAAAAAALAAHVVTKRGRLSHLGLARNPLGGAGASAFAGALRKGVPSLRALDLRLCGCGDAAGAELLLAVRQLSTTWTVRDDAAPPMFSLNLTASGLGRRAAAVLAAGLGAGAFAGAALDVSGNVGLADAALVSAGGRGVNSLAVLNKRIE